ncbi:MAG: DHA2 family efflux MFS transporter permease subunit, partial [Alphaproteobacteria bacterium]|nr:DHA2 family efflux MFS transporter permease subunit [Alphaproteobacteria bacterium]
MAGSPEVQGRPMGGPSSVSAEDTPRTYPSAWKRAVILVPVMTASTTYELNITSVSVALPQMQGTFSATHDQVSWVVTSFIVGMITMLACAGWLSDKFGRKRVFVLSTIGFTFVSFMCGISTTVEEEVLWRFLQGALGAPLMPLSQAICLELFPKEKHGIANAIWGVGVMVGPALGPALGGFIVEYYTWPWIFHIVVPLGAIAAIGTVVFVKETPFRADRRMDWVGLVALTVAVATFQYILNRGERLDWFESTEIVIASAIAAGALYVFVVHSATTAHPFLEPALFRDRNYTVGTTISLVWGFLLHGNLVLVALMMQELRGIPVLTLGLIMSPRGLGVMVGMWLSNLFLRFLDSRAVLASGFLCLFVTAYSMSLWDRNVTEWDVIWTGTLQGVGTGMSSIPLTLMTFATLDSRYRTEGLTFFNVVLFSGISAGIAIAINVLTRSASISHANLSEHISRLNEIARQFGVSMDTAVGRATLETIVSREAAMIAYLNNFLLIALLSVLIVPVVFLFRRSLARAGG